MSHNDTSYCWSLTDILRMLFARLQDEPFGNLAMNEFGTILAKSYGMSTAESGKNDKPLFSLHSAPMVMSHWILLSHA